jgi:type IV secretion system protein VirB9
VKPIRAAIALLAAAPVAAQIQPQPLGSDPRIQVVDYNPDQIVQIQAAPGVQVTLQFASDEQIATIAVGDSSAWQVTANRRGDLLFVKPISGVTTNLTVATDARVYLFELSPMFDASSGVPYTIRFRYPLPAETATAEAGTTPEIQGLYRLSGARALRPTRMADDGVRTYIEWPEESALPAVYTIDSQGREALVNGNMRDGLYVIDSVLPSLVFRIDQDVARAVRRTPQGSP